MALTERTVIDKYEIVGVYNYIQCRHATIIERDGVEIGRSFHRDVIAPGDDVTGKAQEVQNLVGVMHTDAIKAAYAEHLAAQNEAPAAPE
jgi:hypothetical protein